MSSSAGSPNSSRYVEFDAYVDLKLQKTRSTIKTTDLLVALAGVAAMFLGYLLVFVVLDQWVVPGGFGIVLRWLLLSTLVLLTAAWLGWKVGLPYLRSVNRLYAAREIEKADPELKSSLLNLVDLRESGRDVNPTIMRTLEKRAAVELQKIDVTQAIDNRQLMHTAYVLLVVVVLFSLYAFFSPKKISNSIWRSLLPSADVGLATRTEILVVKPGDLTVVAGEKPEIMAEISGEIPEKVTLYYTTIDGAYKDQPVEMRPESAGGTKFATLIIGEMGKGVLQDLTYVVKAGDAVSHEYHIHVKQPPQASGHQVKLEFPAYMKLEPVEQAGGQIDSWEGTKVTVTARTNMPVKRATVELLDDPTTKPGPSDKFPEYPMSISGDGQQLSSTWTLGFNSNGSYSKAYRIQCWTEDEKDPSPIIHSVTIRPDQPPEVAILEPVRDLEAPANSVVPLLVEARDPDFELSHIHLHVKKNGQAVDRIMLSEGRQQRALLKYDLKLDQKMVLNTGDQVEIFVEAFDNKQPRPNRKSTPELKIKIVEPISQKEAEKKLAEDKKNRDQKQQEAEQEQNPDQRPNPPMQNEGEEKSRDNQQQNAQPNDPKQNRQQQEDNQNSADNGGQGGNSGTSGKKGTNAEQGDQSQSQPGSSKNGSNQQKQPGQQDNSKNQPLNPDGDEDGEALKKVLDKLGNKPPRKSDKQQDQGDVERNDSSNESQPNTPKEGQRNGETDNKNPKTEKSNESKKEGMPPTEKDATGNEKEPGNKSRRGDDQQKTGEGSDPMPMPEGADNESGKSEKEGQPKPGGAGGNEKKEPNAKTSDGKTPQPGSEDGDSETKPREKQSPRPGDAPKKDESNEPGKTGDRAKPDKTSDPMKTPGNQEEQSGASGSEKKQEKSPPGGAEKGKDEEKQAAKAAKAGDKSGDDSGAGNKPESKPAMKEGDGTPGEKAQTGDGPRERTNDSNDAKREKATGEETGPAKPDKDPNANPTPSKNQGLERDPKEKPATQPADPKVNDPSNTKSGDPAQAKPKAPGDKPSEKIDQEENNGGKPAEPKRTEKRDGEGKTANEPKKSDGLKDQRSDAPNGGQGGSKKQDAEGNKGSQESGKGDETDRPGEQQATDKKTNQPGGKSQPGTGKKTEEGTGQKKEGEGPGESPDGKSMPKESQSPDGNPSPEQNANSDQKQPEGGNKNPSDKKNSKKDSSSSDKSNGNKPGKEKQQGADKPGGEQKKDGAESGKESSGESGDQKDGQGGEGKGGKGKPSSKPSNKGGGEMKPGNGPAGSKSSEGSLGNGKPSEGSDANGEPGAMDESTLEAGDEANLEYTKQATELVLKRLQDQLDRGDVDPELLKELGWTDAEMRRFTERMTKYLQESKSTEATPESLARRQQFEEMLKSLELKKRGVTRSGDKAQKREIDKTESRQRNVSPEYRSAVERISKELNRQKQPSPARPSK